MILQFKKNILNQNLKKKVSMSRNWSKPGFMNSLGICNYWSLWRKNYVDRRNFALQEHQSWIPHYTDEESKHAPLPRGRDTPQSHRKLLLIKEADPGPLGGFTENIRDRISPWPWILPPSQMLVSELWGMWVRAALRFGIRGQRGEHLTVWVWEGVFLLPAEKRVCVLGKGSTCCLYLNALHLVWLKDWFS